MRVELLAGAAGVSPDTIHYYEKIGLMPQARRTESGYREYPELTFKSGSHGLLMTWANC